MFRKVVVQNLEKKIGNRIIISDVNLKVNSGDLLVITGPNGAGKTTLLRLIAGLIRKSNGEVLLDDKSYIPSISDLSRQIGYLGHRPMIYTGLTAYENLSFFGKMYQIENKSRIESLLSKVGLYLYRHHLVDTFSRGMMQRLGLARTLLHDPTLILYDEPFTGLDPEGQGLFRTTVRELQEAGKIQILTTHNPDYLQGLLICEVKLNLGQVIEVIQRSC